MVLHPFYPCHKNLLSLISEAMTKERNEFIPYSPHLKKYFEKERRGLEKVLKTNLIQVHHIGSTAISSIVAKPILDILVEVHTLDGIELFKSEFAHLGLTLQEGFDKSERLYFARLAPDGASHLSRIHIFEKNSEAIKDHLDFRDYLNAEPKIAKEYEKLKVNLNEQYEESPALYAAGKNEFIQIVLNNIT